MDKIKNIIYNHSLLLIILYHLIISIINAIYVYIPSPDEWQYLHDTIVMSELFKQGHWIGDQMIGTHGFVFKLIPALVFMFIEPTIYMPYFYHILLNILIIYFTYKSAQKLLDSDKWAALATFFLVNIPLFYQGSILNAYLRETPALLTISLVLYLVLYKKNIIWISLALLLSLDAKEYVGVLVIASYVFYLIYETIINNKSNYFKMFYTFFYKLFIILIPISLWLYLMYFTPFIPENQSLSFILKLNIGAAVSNPVFDIRTALYNAKGEDAKLADSLNMESNKEKWKSNKDKMFEMLNNMKYVNTIKQTVDYSKLKYENFDSLLANDNYNKENKIITLNENRNIKNGNANNKLKITANIKEELIKDGKTISSNKNESNKIEIKKKSKTPKERQKAIIPKKAKRVIDTAKFSNAMKDSTHLSDSLNLFAQSDSNEINDSIKVLEKSDDSLKIAKKEEIKPNKINKDAPKSNVEVLKKVPLDDNTLAIKAQPSKKGINEQSNYIGQASKDEINRNKIFESPLNKVFLYVNVVTQRIFSHYTFNYGSAPIFVMISVFLGIILIFWKQDNKQDWMFIVIFLFIVLAVYLLRTHLTRYFHPAVLSISLLFIFVSKEYFKRKWFIIVLLLISLPLSIYQISVNNYTPMFIASLITQLLLLPLIWVPDKYKEKYIISFIFIMIISHISYITNGRINDLKKAPKGNFEQEARLFASHFDLETDSLVYLTHIIYPGRSNPATIKFYQKSLNTGYYSLSYTNLIGNKIPKFFLNKNYLSNIYDIWSLASGSDFSNWNRLKVGNLPKKMLNRFVFLIDNSFDWNKLESMSHPQYKDIYQLYYDVNKKGIDQDHWGVAETYKNLLFKYRPEWLELIEKHPIGDNKTMYIFRINDKL